MYSMYLLLCICIDMYIYIYVYIYICICFLIHLYTYMCIYIYTSTSTRTSSTIRSTGGWRQHWRKLAASRLDAKDLLFDSRASRFTRLFLVIRGGC